MASAGFVIRDGIGTLLVSKVLVRAPCGGARGAATLGKAVLVGFLFYVCF